MILYDYVENMTETQNTLVIIRRNDCLVYKDDDEIPYDFAGEDVEIVTETDLLCVVRMIDECHKRKTETPCDYGECPYNAEYFDACRNFCGLGVDESEYDFE